jgi:hypothetical protein
VYRNSKEAGTAAVNGIANAASAGLAMGVLPADASADFSAVSLHNMDGADVWPIVAMSYAYVRKDLSNMGPKACLLKAFLQTILSPESQSMLSRYNSVGIPAPVKAVADSAIDSLIMPSGADKCVEWSFETATLPGAGQQDYVMSTKRRSFGEYDRTDLRADVMGLIADLHLKIDGNHMVTEDVEADHGHSHDEMASTTVAADSGSAAMGIAVAGLVAGILALLVAIMAYVKANAKSTYGGVDMKDSAHV